MIVTDTPHVRTQIQDHIRVNVTKGILATEKLAEVSNRLKNAKLMIIRMRF